MVVERSAFILARMSVEEFLRRLGFTDTEELSYSLDYDEPFTVELGDDHSVIVKICEVSQ